MIPLLSVPELGNQFEGERDVAARQMDEGKKDLIH